MPPPKPPRRVHSLIAGLLSYLVPGLGQIYQGRIGKGLLFFVCLYGLFFYGQALGSWKNVYMPDPGDKENAVKWLPLNRQAASIYDRFHFAGQFWIGVAAWPAIWQYINYDERQEADRLLGKYQRTPSEDEINRLQRDGDKTWDLGWIYTVIAGVLNILVIYDAFAGPALLEPQRPTGDAKEGAK
jgi:hypothetical protein